MRSGIPQELSAVIDKTRSAEAVNKGYKAYNYCGQLQLPQMLSGSSIAPVKHLEKDSLSFVQEKDRAQVI